MQSTLVVEMMPRTLRFYLPKAIIITSITFGEQSWNVLLLLLEPLWLFAARWFSFVFFFQTIIARVWQKSHTFNFMGYVIASDYKCNKKDLLIA